MFAPKYRHRHKASEIQPSEVGRSKHTPIIKIAILLLENAGWNSLWDGTDRKIALQEFATWLQTFDQMYKLVKAR